MASKFALVIANTEYQDASFAKLTAPGKDAEEFAQVLQDAKLAAFNEVQILLNEGESKIRRSIARFFVNRQRDDLLLLYFSGHGVRNEQGQLFLAASDTEISILEATGIPAEFVTYAMNNSRSQRQLLILDCCNSGAFAYGSKSASAIGKSMGIASAFEGSGFGRVVLTATDATQYAWEGDKVIGNTQKSVFTHFLIEGLRGEADRDGDGRIKVDELYEYTFEQVVRHTPKQTPGKWSYRQQGDIVLRENLSPRDVKPAPLPTELLDLLSHPNPSVRKLGVQDLIGFLDGKHLGLARAAQEKLHEIEENDDSLNIRKLAHDSLSTRGPAVELDKPLPVKDIDPVIIPENPAPSSRVATLPTGEAEVHEKKPRVFPEVKSIASKPNLRRIVAVGGGILALGILTLCIWSSASLLREFPIFVFASTPTQTLTPASAQTSTVPQTPTLDPASTMISEKDGMTLLMVPAGEFTMGNDNGAPDEKPSHSVVLDAFWIDKTEVTNQMYKLCVNTGRCQPPRETDHFANGGYANHPVTFVSWEDANKYCSWAGRSLPTEAQWEKAARGTEAQVYPWGNQEPDSNLLNYNGEIGETTEVGNYPGGVSPYGALDMAGNVSEWIADWYSVGYYLNAPESNPLGPDAGTFRVLRGGAWSTEPDAIPSSTRQFYTPLYFDKAIGFRCSDSQ